LLSVARSVTGTQAFFQLLLTTVTVPSPDLADAAFTDVDWESVDPPGLVRRPSARTAGLVVALAVLVASFAYDYALQPEDLVGEWSPRRLHWLALLSGVLFARYVLVPLAATPERSRRFLVALLRRPAGALSLAYVLFFFGVGLLGPELFEYSYARLAHRVQPPVYTSTTFPDASTLECLGRVENGRCHGTWRYPFGTDSIGTDASKLLVQSHRVAVLVAASTAMVMAVVATAVGVTAGYVGGRVDDLLMRYVDVQSTVPAILVYLILATLYFGELEGISDGGLFAFVLVFGLLDWGGIARLVRAETLERRSAGYVRAAKAAGAGDLRVIRAHLLPNTRATLVTALTRQVPLLVLAQTALAYLELNRAVLSASFGEMIRTGLTQRYLPPTKKWWIVGFAVVSLVALTVAFNAFGDVVRESLEEGST
jgi:peptide/nickel transport system permease protein